MCEECEQADSFAAVYIRKTNRYGWRPPAAVPTVPRCDSMVMESQPTRSPGMRDGEFFRCER
jgi:hypothetical protein